MIARKPCLVAVVKLLARLCLSPFFSLQIHGTQNLPRDEAFILAPKHQRWEDIPLLSLASPRPLYYVAKYELFANRLSNWFMSALGGLPLNRKRPLASRRALQQMLALLHAGEGVVIFPEGTYFEGRMGPGYAGLIRMVQSRLNLPFIPVGIAYSKTGFRTRVQIDFGTPLYETNDNAKENRFFGQIMTAIACLSGLATPE